MTQSFHSSATESSFGGLPLRENPSGFLRQIVGALSAQYRAWGLIVVTALVEAAFAMVSPWIASRAIDSALPNSARSMLRVLAMGVVVAVAHTACAGWLHQRSTIILHHRLEVRSLCEVLRRFLLTPFRLLQHTTFGATHETLQAASTVVQKTVGFIVECATLGASGLVALAFLASYDKSLAAVTMMCAGGIAFISAILSFREAQIGERVLEASSESQELLHVLLRAVPTLRASGATRRLSERWVKLLTAQIGEGVRQATLRWNRTVIAMAGQKALTLLSTAWLAQQVLDGSRSLGGMMTCTMLVGSCLRSAVGLTDSCAGFLVLRPHLARVNTLLRSSTDETTVRHYRVQQPLATTGEGLRLDQVWFRYDPSSSWVLEGHSQDFGIGVRTIVRAASGAGKSTMLRLLAGLLKPERGRVSVLGHDPCVAEGLVVYLPQQFTLLESSIASNLTVLSGASLEQVLEIGKLTGLDHVLAGFPMGVETLVSASGGNLSAGQRQLIALTAVFASSHPVVLLDEATSQLDAASLSRIRWDELAKGRTVVAVQHV